MNATKQNPTDPITAGMKTNEPHEIPALTEAKMNITSLGSLNVLLNCMIVNAPNKPTPADILLLVD